MMNWSGKGRKGDGLTFLLICDLHNHPQMLPETKLTSAIGKISVNALTNQSVAQSTD
jgi:hypothetical protein